MDTTATASAITRDMLYDRYAGLEFENPHDWTPLQQKLSDTLGAFAQRTARCDREDVGGIVDELYDLIREHIVRRVDELGLGA